MTSIRITEKRNARIRELNRLARRMLFGTLSQTRRTCGVPSCRCHHGGPKHGPYHQISYRDSEAGKTNGYHVPQDLVDDVYEAVDAWQQFQALAHEIAELNREELWGFRHRRR